MGKPMKFSNVLIHRNCGFCNLSLQSFSDVFPLFWRDFTLIMADKQQCFLVDGGVSNVACTHRHIAQAVMHVCSSVVVFVVFSRYPSEQENNVMCYVCSSYSAVKHSLKPWRKKKKNKHILHYLGGNTQPSKRQKTAARTLCPNMEVGCLAGAWLADFKKEMVVAG